MSAVAASVAPTATVESASAVKSAAAMESTATAAFASVEFTVEPATTMEASASKAFMVKSAASKIITVPAASAEAAPAPVISIPAAAPAVPVPAVVPIPVIPRARSYKDAVDEAFRAVETVGRAGIGVIVIVAVGTNWRRSYISRAIIAGTHAHAYKHSLRARKRRAKEANAK